MCLQFLDTVYFLLALPEDSAAIVICTVGTSARDIPSVRRLTACNSEDLWKVQVTPEAAKYIQNQCQKTMPALKPSPFCPEGGVGGGDNRIIF